MARLTEEMVIARSKQSDLSAIKKLNCWGAELGDVSLLRRMPNVEVLALSINKIRSLCDFAACPRLRELYVRKNEISSLAELRYLRRLPNLTSLWLDENPCTQHPQYRMTVLRNLPNLEKLDNLPVQPDEVQEAMRRGLYIPDSDDEGYSQQESFHEYRQPRSAESSPEREPVYHRPSQHEAASDSSEGSRTSPAERRPPDDPDVPPCPASPPRREVAERPPEHPMTRSHYISRSARSPDAAPLQHSLSAHSVKEFSYASNGDCRYGAGVCSPQYQDPPYDAHARSDTYSTVTSRLAGGECERDRDSARERDREYPSAVMQEHRGFTRRPVARNSNLLSAVLCLVKELDYPSLEVTEMAVRCRMDELANSQ